MILRKLGGDGGVFVGPIGAEGNDLFGGEFAQDGIGGEDDFLVGLAGRAPAGGEVDVDHAAFGAEFFHGGRAPFLPDDFRCAGGLGGGGLGGGVFGPTGPDAEGENERAGDGAEADFAGLGAGEIVAAVEPHAERDEHEAEEGHERAVLRGLAGEHPSEVGDGGVERERHELLERFHPRAGTGQDFYGGREDREEQIRTGETDRDGGEDGERLDDAQGERGAERGSEKRRGARRGDDGGEHAGEERTGETGFALQIGADAGGAEAELKNAAHVHREDEHHGGEPEDEEGRLQLKTPAELVATGAKHGEDGGERPERKQHAEGEDEAVQNDLFLVLTRLIDEPEDFYAQHGKDARHEVQNEAAEQREEQRAEQGNGRGSGGGRPDRWSGACVGGARSLTSGRAYRGSGGGEGDIDAEAAEGTVGEPAFFVGEHAEEFRGVFRGFGGNGKREHVAAGAIGGDRLREFVGDEVVVGEKAQIGGGG